MKKLSAILFLGLFLISSNAEWVAIFVNRVQMQQRIAATMAMDEGNLETFSFTPAEFEMLHFSPSNKEITIAGKNYDIAEIKKSGNKITVHCLADEKEMQIKLLAKKDQQQKNQQIEKSFSKIFIANPVSTLLHSAPAEETTKLFSYNTSSTCNVYLDIIVPPPSVG
ncbi:MAG: hypothetical protein ABIW38_11475 [Ferruginibacter sp.]